MRKFFQMVIVLSVVTVAGTALYVFLTDKHVIVYNDGTIQTVDDKDVIFLNDGTILYNETVIDQDQVDYYSKRKISHLLLNIRNSLNSSWNGETSAPNNFGSNSTKLVIVFLIAISLIILVVLFFFLTGFKSRHTASETPQIAAKPQISQIKREPSVIEPKVPDREDIVGFFLYLFKCQLGAEPRAKVEFVRLESKSVEPNQIYELRVQHGADWVKRRMTIGPLGEESGSKSKCYSVIYDVHMVVKVPVRPITNFEVYIESIQKEVAIVNKLIPRECIVPKVSVILSKIHSFSESGDLPANRLEDKYINWVRRSPEYQGYLKINASFVYFMDLSQYYFLSNILDELHDIKDLVSREMLENAHTIFEPTKFMGRYGVEKDAIFELRMIYNLVEADIRKLVAESGIDSNIPLYQYQKWFYSALAQKEVVEKGDKYPSIFLNKLNLLLKKAMHENMGVIEVFRRVIKNYVYMSCFEQNSVQMGAIATNLLDVLAWFRQKRVSMRDLKPDNLFVAGDPARYPLFLRSSEEFSLGIIDVETAVDFEKSKYTQIKQPLLGGTPFYATPSHFIRNEVLEIEFGNLGKILHLQDWHATLVMIYKVVVGELLFEQTAKLFGELRNMMISANKPENFEGNIFKHLSQIYWRGAIAEYQTKTSEKERSLRAIEVTLPEPVKSMFGKVAAIERISLAQAIKKCVASQNVFRKQQIRNQLLTSSYAKTCQFKADLVDKAGGTQMSRGLRTEAITFLHQLADLKALLGQHIIMIKSISTPRATVSVYDTLAFMFSVVRNNMYPPHWKPLNIEAPKTGKKPD